MQCHVPDSDILRHGEQWRVPTSRWTPTTLRDINLRRTRDGKQMVLKLGQPCCGSVHKLHDIGRGTCPVVARMFGEPVNVLVGCCPRIHHNNDKHALLELHATQLSVTPVKVNTRWFKTSMGRLKTYRDTFSGKARDGAKLRWSS